MGYNKPALNILTEPYESPSVWRGSDFDGDDSWIRPFTAEEIDEIKNAVATIKSRGLKEFAFDKADFELPTFGKVIEEICDILENGRGFILLRGLPMDELSEEEIRLFYWGLAVHMGVPICQNAVGEYMAEVRDRGYDRKNNNVRGYSTHQRQYPHCDNADMVGLLCYHPAKEGGESSIASSMAIHNEILRTHPEYLKTLYRGAHFDLRGEGADGKRNAFTNHRVPIFSYHEGYLSCRYNGKTIIDGMRKAGKPLNEIEEKAVIYVRELAMSDEFRLDMKFQRGDIQLLSNHSVLHARNAFVDFDEPEKKRRLLRLWVQLYNGRPLEDTFADRNNTGPRQGVKQQSGVTHWVGP